MLVKGGPGSLSYSLCELATLFPLMQPGGFLSLPLKRRHISRSVSSAKQNREIILAFISSSQNFEDNIMFLSSVLCMLMVLGHLRAQWWPISGLVNVKYWFLKVYFFQNDLFLNAPRNLCFQGKYVLVVASTLYYITLIWYAAYSTTINSWIAGKLRSTISTIIYSS